MERDTVRSDPSLHETVSPEKRGNTGHFPLILPRVSGRLLGRGQNVSTILACHENGTKWNRKSRRLELIDF
jgi:hypothetical protein